MKILICFYGELNFQQEICLSSHSPPVRAFGDTFLLAGVDRQ
jgi:hypothetical protein